MCLTFNFTTFQGVKNEKVNFETFQDQKEICT